jgi:hypothetical protein
VSEPIAFAKPTFHSEVAAEGDAVLERLATWLAEVSAEAPMRPPPTDAEPPIAEAAP